MADDASDSSAFNEATGIYTEPTRYDSACASDPPVVLFVWAGIGGVNTQSNLTQAGTADGITNEPNHEFFFRFLPEDAAYIGEYADAGDEIYVDVQWEPSTPGYTFFLEDVTQDEFWPFARSSESYDGSTAEFIYEAPAPSNVENFKTDTYVDALVNSNPIGYYQNDEVAMYMGDDDYYNHTSDTDARVTVSSLSSEETFTATQHHCQWDS